MDSIKAERFEDLGTISVVARNERDFPYNTIRLFARCKECGAVVLYEDRELHLSWHSDIYDVLMK